MENRKEIDGKEVVVYHLSVKNQIRLLKFITQSTGGVVKGLKGVSEKDVVNEDFAKIGVEVISVFMDKLSEIDEEIMIMWIENILERTEIDNKKVKIETGFEGGQLAFLFKVVQFALEVNFGNFFSEAAEKLQDVFKEVKNLRSKESPKQT